MVYTSACSLSSILFCESIHIYTFAKCLHSEADIYYLNGLFVITNNSSAVSITCTPSIHLYLIKIQFNCIQLTSIYEADAVVRHNSTIISQCESFYFFLVNFVYKKENCIIFSANSYTCLNLHCLRTFESMVDHFFFFSESSWKTC